MLGPQKEKSKLREAKIGSFYFFLLNPHKCTSERIKTNKVESEEKYLMKNYESKIKVTKLIRCQPIDSNNRIYAPSQHKHHLNKHLRKSTENFSSQITACNYQ